MREMFLFIVLAVIQSALLVPVVWIVAFYWNENIDNMKGLQHTLNMFIFIMSIIECAFWLISEGSLDE